MSTNEDAPVKKPEKGKKGKTKKAAAQKCDAQRFYGEGVNFKAKLIGCEDVAHSNGDRMCQEMIQGLKATAKSAGHKQRIVINVSLEGMKIMEEKTGNLLYNHAVQRISFISRDVTDNRAFGYIYGPGDGQHRFYGIKTEKAAEGLVLTLRDLFQVVFEMKKKEVEEIKRQKELASNQQVSNDPTPPEPSLGDLLDLESELKHMEQGMQARAFAPSSPGNLSSDSSEPWGSQPATPRSQYSDWGGAVPYPASGVQSDTRPSLLEQAKELQQQAQADPFTVHVAPPAMLPPYQPAIVQPAMPAAYQHVGVPATQPPSGQPAQFAGQTDQLRGWPGQQSDHFGGHSPPVQPTVNEGLMETRRPAANATSLQAAVPTLAAPPSAPPRHVTGRSPNRQRVHSGTASSGGGGAAAAAGGANWATFDSSPISPADNTASPAVAPPFMMENPAQGDPFKSPTVFADRYVNLPITLPASAAAVNPFVSDSSFSAEPTTAAIADPFSDLEMVDKAADNDFFKSAPKPTLSSRLSGSPASRSNSSLSDHYQPSNVVSQSDPFKDGLSTPPQRTSTLKPEPPAFAPPPLPARPCVESCMELSDTPPPPPPRPSLHRQQTLPSLPTRLTPVKSAVLRRQATMPSEQQPPPPPPRTNLPARPPTPSRSVTPLAQRDRHTPDSFAISPDSGTRVKHRVSSGGSIGSRSSGDSHHSVADPFAVTLPYTRGQQQRAATAESCIGRPRPRPRSQTPSSQLPLDSTQSAHSSSVLSPMPDPFADVDPFADPFEERDPSDDVSDPFASDFIVTPPVFSTQVVTADSRSGRLSAASNPFTFAPFTLPPDTDNSSNNNLLDPTAFPTEPSGFESLSLEPSCLESSSSLSLEPSHLEPTHLELPSSSVLEPSSLLSSCFEPSSSVSSSREPSSLESSRLEPSTLELSSLQPSFSEPCELSSVEPQTVTSTTTTLTSSAFTTTCNDSSSLFNVTASKSVDSFSSDNFLNDFIQSQLLSLSYPAASSQQDNGPSSSGQPQSGPSTSSGKRPADILTEADDDDGGEVVEEKEHDTSSSSGISSEASAVVEHCAAAVCSSAPPGDHALKLCTAVSDEDESNC